MIKNELNSSDANSSGYCSFRESDDANVVVDLSEKELTEVPEDLLVQDICRLNLSSNYLSDVTDAFRMNLRNLKELNLSGNNLSEFHKPACSRSLKILDLSSNSLTSIPSWLYMDAMIKLDVLDLSFNFFSSEYRLHYALKSVASITFLNLSNTKLTSKSICALKNMTGLKKLDLSSYAGKSARSRKANHLWDIDLADLPSNLEELVAQDIGLSAFPDLTKVPLLRALDFSGNPLSIVYKDFPPMKSLQKLTLRNCQLCLLPNNFGILSSLRHVNLSHNNIGELPESFSNCKLLVHLDLYNNSLESPPEYLDDFTSLEKLDLSENYFQVPDVFGAKDYATLEANLRSELDEERSNETKVFIEEEEEEDQRSYSGSTCSEYSNPCAEEEVENTEEVENSEEKIEEVWDSGSTDEYVPCEVNFNSDIYDSDDSLADYIAQCPPEIRFSKNFFVPAASYRESKVMKTARRNAMNNRFPPPVPGQFDDA